MPPKAFAGLSSDESSSDEDMAPAAPDLATAPPASADGAAADPEAGERAATRFRVELEFVQCLASPLYLEYLAQRDFFEDAKFLRYLEYLRYFERPAYAAFLEYPDCLTFLDLLLVSPKFRADIRGAGCRDWAHQAQYESWKNRHKTRNETPDLEPPPPGAYRTPRYPEEDADQAAAAAKCAMAAEADRRMDES